MNDYLITERTKEVRALTELGHKVVELTPYQFRIDDSIDLFPVNRKFHNIKTNERGDYPGFWAPDPSSPFGASLL